MVFGIRKKKIQQPFRREGTTHSPITRAVLSSSQSAVSHGRIYRVSPETVQNRRFPQRPPRAKVVLDYKRILPPKINTRTPARSLADVLVVVKYHNII